MTIGFYTFGCKVNQYETQATEQLFREKGWEIGDFDGDCDVYLINTCSVTAMADRKNRTLIRHIRRTHPEAILAVCGCYSQHEAGSVADLDVDVVGGSADRGTFVEEVIQAAENRVRFCQVDEPMRRRAFEILPPGGVDNRTRALLKVQDGCVNFCTYCIIPYTRGPVRSAPLEIAVEQAKELSRKGYREIVVTGIEIASWGVDLPGKPDLSVLTRAVCQAVPECRVRLGSLEPRVVTEEFCETIKHLPNLCPQFHLSMQSGSDTVLKRMHRKYDTRGYMESVNRLRAVFPDCAITTDMIVGFPGETEEEFAESLAFMEQVGFAAMHIFPYSRRPGTPADKMEGQLPRSVKQARSRTAIALAEHLSRHYREQMVGKTCQVLFEQQEGNGTLGHAENYVSVWVAGEMPRGSVWKVEITGLTADGVTGMILQDLDG